MSVNLIATRIRPGCHLGNVKIAAMDARSAIILLKLVQIVVKVTGWIPPIIYVRLNVKGVFLLRQAI